jgi:hypothetical protein
VRSLRCADPSQRFQSVAQLLRPVANKLTATLSPKEKKRIEATPTENLEAYDLYLRAKELIGNARVSINAANVEKPLLEAISFLRVLKRFV